jgi:hypothetical protein
MFVMPVHGSPPWLERCLDSLRRQTRPSRIVMTTSTPNEDVARIARDWKVPLEVNPVAAGIAADWNFALERADAAWVTLAHQDDWYHPEYAEACLRGVSSAEEPVLVFTRARDVVEDQPAAPVNALVKRLMCAGVFAGRTSIAAPWRKRLLLRFGDPIPCSTVAICRQRLPGFRFADGWRCGLDWNAWLGLASRPGTFVYVPRALVQRTIHRRSATVAWLDDRAADDARILRELWPAPIATIICRAYSWGRRPYARLGVRPGADAA